MAHREDRASHMDTADRSADSAAASLRNDRCFFVTTHDSASIQASCCVLDDPGTLVRKSGCDHRGESTWDGSRSADVRYLQTAIDVNCLVPTASRLADCDQRTSSRCTSRIAAISAHSSQTACNQSRLQAVSEPN